MDEDKNKNIDLNDASTKEIHLLNVNCATTAPDTYVWKLQEALIEDFWAL